MTPLERLQEPFRQPELLEGFGTAIPAVVVVAALGYAVRTRTGRPAAVAGLAIAVAALVALDPIRAVPPQLVMGVIVAALGGALRDVGRLPVWVAGVGSMPGAYLVATSPGVPGGAGFFAVAFVTVVAGGTGVASFDDRWGGAAVAPAMLMVAAGAIYSTLPDTESALVLLGVTIVISVAGWPLRLARLGAAGSFASVAVFAWAIAVDGVGRDGSVVGAGLCLGLLVVEPVATMIDRRSGRDPVASSLRSAVPGDTAVVVALAVHTVIALYMARVAGLLDHFASAAAVAAAGFAIATGAWSIISERIPP